jgi:hypothetical protein
MTVAAQTNRDLVIGALGALLEGDVEGFTGYMHPNIDLFEPDYLPYGGHYHGVEALIRCFGEVSALIDASSLEIVSVIADDDVAVLLTKCKLVGDGSERLISEHWRIEDHRVREVRVFWSALPA